MENFSILRIELSIATIEIQFLFRFVETLENEKKKNLSIYNLQFERFINFIQIRTN